MSFFDLLFINLLISLKKKTSNLVHQGSLVRMITIDRMCKEIQSIFTNYENIVIYLVECKCFSCFKELIYLLFLCVFYIHEFTTGEYIRRPRISTYHKQHLLYTFPFLLILKF